MQVPSPYDSSHSFNMSHLYNISPSWMCPTHMTFRTHNCEHFSVCSAHVTNHTDMISLTHECVLPTWHLALINESVLLYALPIWHVTLMWHLKLVKEPYPYLLWCGACTFLHVSCMCCACFCHSCNTRQSVIQVWSKFCRGALEDALLYGMRFCVLLRFIYIYSNTYIRKCTYLFIRSARNTRPSLIGELSWRYLLYAIFFLCIAGYMYIYPHTYARIRGIRYVVFCTCGTCGTWYAVGELLKRLCCMRCFFVCDAFLCIAAIYVYISTHIHTYVYIYIHTLHTHTHTHVCMYIYTPWCTSWLHAAHTSTYVYFWPQNCNIPLSQNCTIEKCVREDWHVLKLVEMCCSVLQHASRLVCVAVCCIAETDMCCSVLQRAKFVIVFL